MEDLFHPRKQAARAQFYSHSATIKKTVGDAGSDDETNFDFEDVLVGKACKGETLPAQRPGGTFESEAPATDRVLFQECWPEIEPGMKLVIELAGVEKWFDVLDVAHIASATQTLCTLRAR